MRAHLRTHEVVANAHDHAGDLMGLNQIGQVFLTSQHSVPPRVGSPICRKRSRRPISLYCPAFSTMSMMTLAWPDEPTMTMLSMKGSVMPGQSIPIKSGVEAGSRAHVLYLCCCCTPSGVGDWWWVASRQ